MPAQGLAALSWKASSVAQSDRKSPQPAFEGLFFQCAIHRAGATVSDGRDFPAGLLCGEMPQPCPLLESSRQSRRLKAGRDWETGGA